MSSWLPAVVRPNPEATKMFCEVLHHGEVIGTVVCSTLMTRWPFRSREGYRVRVLVTSSTKEGKMRANYKVRYGTGLVSIGAK